MPAEPVVRRTSTGSSPTWQPVFSPLLSLSVFDSTQDIFEILSSGAQDHDEDFLLLQ